MSEVHSKGTNKRDNLLEQVVPVPHATAYRYILGNYFQWRWAARAKLPQHIKENEEFQKVSTSLKSPCNAAYYRAIATWLELLNRSTVT